MSATDCRTGEELNSYLSGSLTAGERERVESHLALCRQCRHLLAVALESSKPEPQTYRAPQMLKARAVRIGRGERAASRSLVFGLPIRYAAASAIFILAISATMIFFFRSSERLPTDRLRQQEGFSIAPQLLSPAGGATVTTDQIEFRWSEVQGARSYHLTVMNETGDIVFRAQAERERLSVNSTDARLESGKTYFWFVTAKSIDEATVDSVIFKFVFNH